ncbi:hypothetical protein QAD02_017012 [Eretmocerus hayati]|uniref:Uncharacterized protein n=1 Tax=Eretmocerus hayati TaxID=131215 RepID=A0ACC2PHI9_9HYME|nr:hypothetical protein QAD02_017012 [Eretmocerus hayati]
MLQFFKKSGYRDRPKSLILNDVSANPANLYESGSLDTSFLGSPSSLCSLQEEEEDDAFEDGKSRLNTSCLHPSKRLPEILSNKSALGYFMQFMDAQKEVSLVKFWLDVESLRGAHSSPKCHSNSNVNKKLDELTESALDLSSTNNCACSIISTSVSGSEIDAEPLDNNVNNNRVDESLESPVMHTRSNLNQPKISALLNNETGKVGGLEKHRKGSSFFGDVLCVYQKYVADDSLGLNCIPPELRVNIDNAVTTRNTELILDNLYEAQKVIYNILENNYVDDFLRSEYHSKHQIDLLTSGNVKLVDILFDESAFFYFMEFMELENKRELLDFWMTTMNYKQNLSEERNSADSADAQTDALIIYEKYFSLQATTPLGFTDKIRFQVEQNICREDGKSPQPDCFDRPCQIVYNFLSKHYLPTFLQSQLFYKYLSELINSVQSSHYPIFHPSIKRAGSDCGSEISSISNATSAAHTHNDEKQTLKSRSSAHGSMNIDTRQLYDPDSLWKRNKSSLSVGYVDNLGRFVTEIEPDPCRKNERESRLSRAVKRLVHLEQDKAKEESAWKIAEMIVRDVTSLTLGASDLPS